jgi:hypothetical protein
MYIYILRREPFIPILVFVDVLMNAAVDFETGLHILYQLLILPNILIFLCQICISVQFIQPSEVYIASISVLPSDLNTELEEVMNISHTFSFKLDKQIGAFA